MPGCWNAACRYPLCFGGPYDRGVNDTATATRARATDGTPAALVGKLWVVPSGLTLLALTRAVLAMSPQPEPVTLHQYLQENATGSVKNYRVPTWSRRTT